jgi:hypothetical protein
MLRSIRTILLTTGDNELPADSRTTKWFRYVDDVYVVSLPGPARLQQSLYHLSSLRPTIKLKMEGEIDNTLPFLHVLVM